MFITLLRYLSVFTNRQSENTSRRIRSKRRLRVESLEERKMLSLWGTDFDLREVAQAEVESINHASEVAETASNIQAASRTARIVNGTPTNSFESVGIVGDQSGGFCSGTLISPTHVLTAAHCAEGVGDTQGRFEVNGATYSTSEVFVHSGWNGDTNDIAIYELSQAVSGVNPSPIFRGTPQVGQMLTIVGFGGGGTGDSGHNGDFGTKRVGTTPIDEVEPLWINWTFDNNDESNTAPGDSGGPAFVEVGGVLYVAGVTSGGSRDDAAIGDFSYDVRVDAYADWIDSIVNDSQPDPNPTPDPTPTPDPDPTPDPSPTPDPVDDDFVDQPGENATQISIDQGFGFVDGNLEIDGDRDVFAVELASPSQVYIDLFSWNGDLDTNLVVLDANGNVVTQNDNSFEGTDSSIATNLDAGTYYLSAQAAGDAGTGEYGLDVFVERAIDTTPSPDPIDPVPTPDPIPSPDPIPVPEDDHVNLPGADATEISIVNDLGVASGVIEVDGDRDVFQFTLLTETEVSINLFSATSDLDSHLQLLDSDGDVVAENNTDGSIDSHLTLILPAGTHFISAGASGDMGTGEFNLDIELLGNTDPTPDPDPTPEPDPEPDPTPQPIPEDDHVDLPGADATLIEIEDGYGYTHGVLEIEGDHDVFQVTLESDGHLYIDLFSWNCDLDTHLQVLDIDGNVVAENDDAYGSTDSSLGIELAAGTYYVSAGASGDAGTGEYGVDVLIADDGVDDEWCIDMEDQGSGNDDEMHGHDETDQTLDDDQMMDDDEMWGDMSDEQWDGDTSNRDESFCEDDLGDDSTDNMDDEFEDPLADDDTSADGEDGGGTDDFAQMAFDLDEELGLEMYGSYYEDWGGFGEKWVRASSGDWYFIRTGGELYLWDGSSDLSTSSFVAALDASCHEDPSLLHDAPDPNEAADPNEGAASGGQQSEGSVESMQQTAFNLDQSLGLRMDGSYFENWGDMGEKWVRAQDNAWYFITPDGSFYEWDGSSDLRTSGLVTTLDPSCYDDPSLLHDAPNPDSLVTIQDDPADIDQRLGLRLDGSYFENWGGKNEKWLRGETGTWYFITPDGSLYKWGGTSDLSASEMVASVDAQCHTDPALLYEAAELASV